MNATAKPRQPLAITKAGRKRYRPTVDESIEAQSHFAQLRGLYEAACEREAAAQSLATTWKRRCVGVGLVCVGLLAALAF